MTGRDFPREKLRKLSNYTCGRCGKIWQTGERRFDTHHLDCDKNKTKGYDRVNESFDNMIVLCHKCHLNLPEHRLEMKLSYLKRKNSSHF